MLNSLSSSSSLTQWFIQPEIILNLASAGVELSAIIRLIECDYCGPPDYNQSAKASHRSYGAFED